MATSDTGDSCSAFLSAAGARLGGDGAAVLDQARALLEQAYVHLPVHRAAGADPVERIDQLRRRSREIGLRQLYDELLRALMQLGDRHTRCFLPAPFSDKLAFLPFVAGEFFEGGAPRLAVIESKTDELAAGDLLISWNGAPVEDVLERHMASQQGAHGEARRARAVQTLSFRPLAWMPPPDDDDVVLECLTARGRRRAARLRWQVAGAASVARRFATAPDAGFGARAVVTRQGVFGYMRVQSFHDHPEAFLRRFASTLERMPRKGLILDLRGCEEGLVPTGERIIQLFTPRRVHPALFEFRVTRTILDIVRTSSALAGWRDAVERADREGQTYSGRLPLTSHEEANDVGQLYRGPVVLLVDALTYSTAEMVAAGFQDHEIGPIVGAARATGGGGASPWAQGLIHRLSRSEVFRPLPGAPTYRVAVRRCWRVHEMSGVSIEGSGVVPDVLHLPTRRDLLSGGEDLMEAVGEILSSRALIAR
ncbi:S41 family peptidase [Sorangium sp. So ce118]